MIFRRKTCRSALAREGLGSDDRDASAAPASSRASALLRLRQKRVRQGLGGGTQRANLDAGLFSRADMYLAYGTKPVGARLPAKALVLTIEMCRLHRPLRGQARSYAFGRSGFGGGPQRANLDAGLFSRADIGFGVWHKTCRSALAREGFVSDERDVSAVPASSRASALLRLRQKRVRRGLGGGPQRANLDAGLFSRADIGFGVWHKTCRSALAREKSHSHTASQSG